MLHAAVKLSRIRATPSLLDISAMLVNGEALGAVAAIEFRNRTDVATYVRKLADATVLS
jgi:sensor histidine kinase regulating citrate/malate metabolism